MKKILILPLLFLLIFTGCNDSEKTEDPNPTQIARVVIGVRKQNLENGKLTAQPVNAIIHLWKAENRYFDVAASGEDIYIGYAYDKTSKSWLNSDYGSIGTTINEDVTPGRYFAYVILNKTSTNGSQAYSYTYFDIKAGERAYIIKTFSHNVGNNENEPWGKNK